MENNNMIYIIIGLVVLYFIMMKDNKEHFTQNEIQFVSDYMLFLTVVTNTYTKVDNEIEKNPNFIRDELRSALPLRNKILTTKNYKSILVKFKPYMMNTFKLVEGPNNDSMFNFIESVLQDSSIWA